MMTRTVRTLAALAAALLAGACGGGSGATSSTASTSGALAATLASATASTGTLLCTPNPAQIAACSALAAGAACTLTATVTAPDGSTTTRTTAGTCRTTLDGTAVACAPTPPAPPAALVDACAGKAIGDTCDVIEPDGDTHSGLCVAAMGGSTVICGRAHVPPQGAIDACTSLAAGDACRFAGMMGATVSGVCSLGPASTGVLACAPAQALRPSATAACSGLAAGAACAIGLAPHMLGGTCLTPAEGGDAVCIAACAAVDGPFRCGPGGMGPGPHMGPGMP